MVACTFHNGDGTTIAHGKAFTHTTVHVEFSTGGTIQPRVAGDDVVLCYKVCTPSCWRQDADATATKSLAEVVVGFAFQTNVEPLHGKGSKRLTCRTLELQTDGAVGQSRFSIFLRNHAREHCACGSVSVLDGVVETHLLLILDGILSRLDDFLIFHAVHLRELATIPVERLVGVGTMEQTGKVDGFLLVGGMLRMHLDEVCATDNLLEALHSDFCKILTHLFCQEREEIDHIVGSAHETLAKCLVLCSHTDRAGVGVALAHHHTSQHDERQCAETELVSTQQCHDDHILGGFQLSIGLQPHLVTESIHHQCLLRLCQANLRTDARKAHRRGRTGTRATFGTADDDEVGLSLCHTCGNRAHTALCH